MNGKLSTHALDTYHGRPARDLLIHLSRQSEGGAWEKITSVRTNADGRTESPLLTGTEMAPGRYELIFCVGAYFSALNLELPTPLFLDEVPIRFGVAEAGYHVPLLFSPWAYSTYRGS